MGENKEDKIKITHNFSDSVKTTLIQEAKKNLGEVICSIIKDMGYRIARNEYNNEFPIIAESSEIDNIKIIQKKDNGLIADIKDVQYVDSGTRGLKIDYYGKNHAWHMEKMVEKFVPELERFNKYKFGIIKYEGIELCLADLNERKIQLIQ